jgi:hypothetical protein
MLESLEFTLGKNTHGQWLVRHDVTGHMALFDNDAGVVLKPGSAPSPALYEAFVWVLHMALACDALTEMEGASPCKA